MHPVLIEILGFTIFTYPVLVGVSLVLSGIILIKKISKKNLSLDFLNDYFYILIITAFLGARLGGILENSFYYLEYPKKIFSILDGNYSFYGSIILIFLVFYFLTKLKKEKFSLWLDALSPALLNFFFFLSIGDFLAGKNYGVPTNFFWGVSFNIPEIRYTVPIHPVQLYESLGIILIFLFVFIFFKFNNKNSGKKGSLSLFLYFLLIFILNFLRVSGDNFVFQSITWQNFWTFSLSLFFFLVFIWYSQSKNNY
jgi:phosphatidylglycerol:prolipoprotein diacylglycerol transferase